jgi:hypothetical protein
VLFAAMAGTLRVRGGSAWRCLTKRHGFYKHVILENPVAGRREPVTECDFLILRNPYQDDDVSSMFPLI